MFSLKFGGSRHVVVLNDYASVSEAFKNPDITARNYNVANDKAIGADGKDEYHFRL